MPVSRAERRLYHQGQAGGGARQQDKVGGHKAQAGVLAKRNSLRAAASQDDNCAADTRQVVSSDKARAVPHAWWRIHLGSLLQSIEDHVLWKDSSRMVWRQRLCNAKSAFQSDMPTIHVKRSTPPNLSVLQSVLAYQRQTDVLLLLQHKLGRRVESTAGNMVI